MNSLYEKESYDQIIARFNTLTPDTQRLWGKMSVSQMMAHCSVGIRMMVGDVKPKRSLIGFLIGRFYKGMLTGAIKMPKNSPTSPAFIITEEKDFLTEKETLMTLLKRMHEGGEAGATTHPNPFFGKLTPSEWGQGQYHHLDHHLRQFGTAPDGE
jgi:Protein of unknown function (DUF1569)